MNYFIKIIIFSITILFSCTKEKDVVDIIDVQKEYSAAIAYEVYSGSENPSKKYWFDDPIGVTRMDSGILDFGTIIYEGNMKWNEFIPYEEPDKAFPVKESMGIRLEFVNQNNSEIKIFYRGEKYGSGEYYMFDKNNDGIFMDYKSSRGDEYPPQIISHGKYIVEIPVYEASSPWSNFYDFQNNRYDYLRNILFLDVDRDQIITGNYVSGDGYTIHTKENFTEIHIFSFGGGSYYRKPEKIYKLSEEGEAKQVVSVRIKDKKLIVYYKDLIHERFQDGSIAGSKSDANAIIKTIEFNYE
ncbi:hypothetical protein FACS1894130_13410 [Spirochaetia bacterium]|nr:hypothetical protein FACS1894130_13410 [Spirochaetia bacterium]